MSMTLTSRYHFSRSSSWLIPSGPGSCTARGQHGHCLAGLSPRRVRAASVRPAHPESRPTGTAMTTVSSTCRKRDRARAATRAVNFLPLNRRRNGGRSLVVASSSLYRMDEGRDVCGRMLTPGAAPSARDVSRAIARTRSPCARHAAASTMRVVRPPADVVSPRRARTYLSAPVHGL